MSEALWVRSHVRQLLQDAWEVCRVHVDREGDVPFRRGCAIGWVRVIDTEPAMVRVFAHAAVGVRPSAKLFRWLNGTQANALTARIDYDDGLVAVAQTVHAVGLTGPVLMQAVDEVGCLADEIGPLVAAMFDGVTPFDADVEQDVDEEAS